MLAHSEYRPRYWSLATQLKTSHPENVDVWKRSLTKLCRNTVLKALHRRFNIFSRLSATGQPTRSTFEELAKLLAEANRDPEALDVLEKGIKLAPYDAELYRASIKILVARNEMRKACDIATERQRKFPQDDVLRALLPQCHDVRASDKESK